VNDSIQSAWNLQPLVFLMHSPRGINTRLF